MLKVIETLKNGVADAFDPNKNCFNQAIVNLLE